MKGGRDMRIFFRIFSVSLLIFIGACAHPINISPKVMADEVAAPNIKKSVAYVITQSDRDLEVTTDGGGGDKVRYFPYRDLESGIYQALSALFSRVTLVRTLSDEATLSKNDASLVMVPKITTSSSSDGMFTWPPTQFSIVIDYRFQDRSGGEVYRNMVMGEGRATFSEFSAARDFALAGRRAAEDVLKKLKDQISAASVFK